MNLVPKSCISSKRGLDIYSVPETIDLACPYCGRIVALSCSGYSIPSNLKKNLTFLGKCPACKKESYFWAPDIHSTDIGDIFVYPEASSERPEMYGIEHLPKGLRHAYLETLDVFRANKWVATSVMCRRTLEGIIYSIMKEDASKKALYSMLKELPEKVNLTEKVVGLAEGVRKVGNLGAHFDEECVPDQETATMLVEFIEYLLEFVYILPKKAEELNQRANEISNKKVENLTE